MCYHCVGRISNERLNLLYNNAFALIYPSYYEGFGIPVLEAQKAGCPVIAYNSSSITEIIGNTTLLLNELSVDSLKKKFELLENEEIKVDGVCSITSDFAVPTVNYVARKLGLVSNPEETELLARNKFQMRLAFKKIGHSGFTLDG